MNEDSLRPYLESSANPEDLIALNEMLMPFGKYKGRLLIDLPEPYVIWLATGGFPEGKLGRMLQTIYEIKVNGLEYLFEPLRQEQYQERVVEQKSNGRKLYEGGSACAL